MRRDATSTASSSAYVGVDGSRALAMRLRCRELAKGGVHYANTAADCHSLPDVATKAGMTRVCAAAKGWSSRSRASGWPVWGAAHTTPCMLVP